MGGVAGGQVTDTLPDWLQASLDADPTLGQVGVVADWLDEHGHPLAPGWRWLWANGRVPWGYGRAYLWSDWTKDAEDLSELPGTVLDLFIVKATVVTYKSKRHKVWWYDYFSAAYADAARAVVESGFLTRVE
jgi:hypothetical protein